MSVSASYQAPAEICIAGALSFASVQDLMQQTRPLFKKNVVDIINLQGVTHCDSAGLALLLEWQRWARQQGRIIKFKAIPSTITAFAKVCGIYPLISAGML